MPPASPSGLRVSASGEDFIEWTWNAVEGADGYDVQFSPNEAFTSEDAIVPRTREELSYRREGLAAGTNAHLRVRSASGSGDARITSDWSTHVTGMTAAPNPTIPPPPAPTGLRVSDRGEDFIEWTWNAVEGADGYDVQFSPNEAFTSEDEIIPRAVGELSYRREGLPASTNAYLRVRSSSGSGDARITSDWSTHVTGTTAAPEPTIPPPPAPTGLRVSDRGEDFIEWEWRPVPDVDGYVAEFSLTATFTGSGRTLETLETSLRIDRLDPNTDGYLRVLSFMGSGPDRVQGEWSSVSVGTTEQAPLSPNTRFGFGTWLVGSDIEPGRYFTNPDDACYWERLSGLSGAVADIIANEFIGFDSLQEIVDIDPSDLAFSTDEDCGTWDQSPESPPSAGTIPPGTWLVGGQVEPGVYEADAADGCYWERLSGFGGSVVDDVLDNDFVSGGGRQLVEIGRGDVGFSTNENCGTWRAVGNATGVRLRDATAFEAIEANRRLHEAHRDRHRPH